MLPRIFAVLAALLVLSPFALAGPSRVAKDAAGDDVGAWIVPRAPGTLRAPDCHDKSIDLLRATLVSDGATLVATLEVANRDASPTCAPPPALFPVSRFATQWRLSLLDFESGRGIIVYASVTDDGIRACHQVGKGMPGEVAWAAPECETRTLDAPLVWSVPVVGTWTDWDGATSPYDLRGATFPDVDAHGWSESEAIAGSTVFIQDHVSVPSITL